MKRRVHGQVQATMGNVSYLNHLHNTWSIFQITTQRVPYYNSATGAVVPVDSRAAAGSPAQTIKCVYTQSKLVVVNPVAIPVKVTVYQVRPKMDTNISPTGAISNGLADQDDMELAADTINGSIIITGNFPMIYPEDSAQFRDLFIVQKKTQRIIGPGGSFMVSGMSGPVDWDPGFYNSHQLEYQASLGTMVYMIRVEGTIGHATAATTVAPMNVAIMTQFVLKQVFRYDSGADLDQLRVIDSAAADGSAYEQAACVAPAVNVLSAFP